MRKLIALAAVATFALTLTLGVIGCAKTEQTTTETPATDTPAETPAPMDSMADTTSHM